MGSLKSLQEKFATFHSKEMEKPLPDQLKNGRIEGILSASKVNYEDYRDDANDLENVITKKIEVKQSELKNLRDQADGNVKLSDGQTALEKKNAIHQLFSEQIEDANKKVTEAVNDIATAKLALNGYIEDHFGPTYRMARRANWKTGIGLIALEFAIMTVILWLEVGLNESLFYGLGINVNRAMGYAISMSLVLAFVNFAAGTALAWSLRHPLKKYKSFKWVSLAIIIGIICFTYFFTDYRDKVLSTLNGAQTGGSFATMFMLASIAYVAASIPPLLFLDGIPFWEKRQAKALQSDVQYEENELEKRRDAARAIKAQQEAKLKEVSDEVSTLGTNSINNASQIETAQNEVEELKEDLNEAKTGKDALLKEIRNGFTAYVQKVLDHYRSNAGSPDFDEPASQTWSL